MCDNVRIKVLCSRILQGLPKVVGVCYIRVFVNFQDNPYYEPLPWFMMDSQNLQRF